MKTTNEKYKERQKWFIDRIGKMVYRNQNGCDCVVCKACYEIGVRISDRTHAIYLHDTECYYAFEGISMQYFDTIEERDKFEKNII